MSEFVASGAENLVTVCAGCYENYHNKPELKTIDMIDVIYKAFAGARLETDAVSDRKAPQKWQNMVPVEE